MRAILLTFRQKDKHDWWLVRYRYWVTELISRTRTLGTISRTGIQLCQYCLIQATVHADIISTHSEPNMTEC